MAEIGLDLRTGPALEAREPSVEDFVSLMKPRVMSLVVLTALTGMVAAPGVIHPVLGLIAIIAITIGAGASGALNMWYDADIDAQHGAHGGTSHSARPRDRPTRLCSSAPCSRCFRL